MRIVVGMKGAGVLCGMTQVDAESLPWPGITFSTSNGVPQSQVDTSIAMLARELGVGKSDLVMASQVHGVAVQRAVRGVLSVGDALITQEQGVVLGIRVADCCGVMLYDPVNRALGAVHSGWRGTAQGVVTATIMNMNSEYGTQPQDLRVWMSACASSKNYQVGVEVHTVLSTYCNPDPHSPTQWYFDNHRALTAELLANNVQDSNIARDRSCTITSLEYHSHRRDAGRSGRCLTFGLMYPEILS